jgi:LPXTG-motif cell wall-anchored protein
MTWPATNVMTRAQTVAPGLHGLPAPVVGFYNLFGQRWFQVAGVLVVLGAGVMYFRKGKRKR